MAVKQTTFVKKSTFMFFYIILYKLNLVETTVVTRE